MVEMLTVAVDEDTSHTGTLARASFGVCSLHNFRHLERLKVQDLPACLWSLSGWRRVGELDF